MDKGRVASEQSGNSKNMEAELIFSLRLKLDLEADRLTVELEPGTPATTKPIKLDGYKAGGELQFDGEGYLIGVVLPGVKVLLASLAGEDRPEKPGKTPR